jgi:hypothetical protein
MRRKLTIIARTCAKVFALHGDRYVQATKPEIINRCLSSLVNSINQVNNHDIELFVLDDHSMPDCVKDIQHILSHCRFPTKFIAVEDGTGASHTVKRVYQLVEQHATDLWYHIEDDYLHFPEAVQDMIDTVDHFTNNDTMIAINPHDDIWRYTRQIYQSFLLLGPRRHYRTVRHTTYTCLASRQIFDKYRNHFDDAAEWILRRDENDTINMVWNKPDVMLLSPIPGLALHLMEPSGKDPYIDFDALWNAVPELWKSTRQNQ